MSATRLGGNRQRFLAELVSIDAWHETFKVDEKTAGVFVEISFREGRIGGDDGDLPFTFKVSLRKAALLVRLERPLRLERNSVARSIPENHGELTRVKSAKEMAERSLGGSIGMSPEAFASALNINAGLNSQTSRSDELKVVQTIPEIMVTPFPEGANAYSWNIEPTWNAHLRGQPWDPVSIPRMRVGIDGKIPKIEPAITVEIRCAFEDIDIYDLETKSDSVFGIIKDSAFNITNQKAAIQHLKKLITEADLMPAKMDNRFNEVILASVLAMEA